MSRLWLWGAIEPTLPDGGILPLASGYSLPTGFSSVDTNLGRYLMGGTTSGWATGGSSTVHTGYSDTGTSSHFPDDAWAFMRQYDNGIGDLQLGVGEYAGGHQHPVTFSYSPAKVGLNLIQAVGIQPVPEGGILLATAFSLSSLDVMETSLADTDGLLCHETSTSTVAEVKTAALTNVNNAHVHHQANRDYTAIYCGVSHPYIVARSQPTGGASHTHGLATISYTYDVKMKMLTAFRRIAGGAGVTNRAIIMYDRDEIPSGWTLCDGSNGSPNLVGYFITVTTSPSMVEEGTNVIYGSASFSSGGSHNHPLSNTNTGTLNCAYAHNSLHTHTHSATFGSKTWLPLYKTIKFIQFKG